MNSDDSMFTNEQRVLLFEITRRVAMRRVKNQNEFVSRFAEKLATIIKLKDKREAQELLSKAAKWCDIPFDDGPGAA